MNKLSFSREKVETNFLLTCTSAFYLGFLNKGMVFEYWSSVSAEYEF